ncbi:MAG TPA: hypothetical protein VF153_00320 [Candidatus Limnocylindria bacterium]
MTWLLEAVRGVLGVEKNANMLVVACPEDIGSMHADLTRVWQALFNLLSNTAKFTDHGMIMLTANVSRTTGSRLPSPTPVSG